MSEIKQDVRLRFKNSKSIDISNPREFQEKHPSEIISKLAGGIADQVEQKKGSCMNLSDSRKLHSLIKMGIRAKGLTGIEKLQRGGKLGRAEAIKAKCYDCTSGYADGAVDCEDNSCPLYEYHPYRSLEGHI